jgi:hypothetical protein
VGFNHFFRGKDHGESGDQVLIQGHAAPGIYARAFLEGRLTEQQLDGFRQELSRPGGGLPSYPHPRLMPDFWEFPTVSMGLGALNAIYQARFNRYLLAREIADTSRSHVWAFLGDGEMDEPEATGAIGLAAREELDNLTFVINCNLQRLDGLLPPGRELRGDHLHEGAARRARRLPAQARGARQAAGAAGHLVADFLHHLTRLDPELLGQALTWRYVRRSLFSDLTECSPSVSLAHSLRMHGCHRRGFS